MSRWTPKNWRNYDPWEFCGLGNDCKRSCVISAVMCDVAKMLIQLAKYEDQAENKLAMDNGHGIKFCPICHGSLWQNADESKYCFRCGQKIKWE